MFDAVVDLKLFERDVSKGIDQQMKLMGQGLYMLGEFAMRRIKEDYVPVQTGQLRASGRVDKPQRKMDELYVDLVFSADYAWKVHEGTGSKIGRNPDRPLAGRKYAERGMVEVWASAQERLHSFYAARG